MNYVNSVTITGLVHHLSQKKGCEYFPFSIRHENFWTDGTNRKDFLNARAFPSEVQELVKSLPENAPIRVYGTLRSSKGSGELYLAVLKVEALSSLPPQPENSVELSGYVHFVKAQAEGENGTGKYIRFAVRQENPDTGRDFIVVRVYDDEQKTTLASLNDGDNVNILGTLRSSRGIGVNYVRCLKIGQ